jgi:uncharacterized membrane protein YphA (DoxX/SURF4 family)
VKLFLTQLSLTLAALRRTLDAGVVAFYTGLFCIGLGLGLWSPALALVYVGIVVVAIALAKPPAPPSTPAAA